MKKIFIDGKETQYAFNKNYQMFNVRTNKILKQMDWTKGYKMYNIYTGSHATRKRVLVHRLIAMVYLGLDLNSTLTVNHKDGDKANNHPDNLEIVSINENIEHAFDTGLSTGKCYRSCIAEKEDGTGFWFPSIHSTKKEGFNTGNVHDALKKGIKLYGYTFTECKS